VILPFGHVTMNICSTYTGCAVVKFCTKVERNRAIRVGVIAISIFVLSTLTVYMRWARLGVALVSGIIFTKLNSVKLSVPDL